MTFATATDYGLRPRGICLQKKAYGIWDFLDFSGFFGIFCIVLDF
jgi:hypothetical protein